MNRSGLRTRMAQWSSFKSTKGSKMNSDASSRSVSVPDDKEFLASSTPEKVVADDDQRINGSILLPSTAVVLSPLQALVQDCDDTPDVLSTKVALYFHNRYTEFVAKKADQGRTGMDIILQASLLLVDDFVTIQDSADRETIHHELDDYIYPRISLLYTDISKLETSNVAKLISWAEHYQSKVVKAGLSVSKDRLADFEELATEYLKRGVHDPMKYMIQNSLGLVKKEIITVDPNGYLITCHPEDIAFMIEMQLTVARQALPPMFLGNVLTACNEEVFNMISDIMLDVESRWREIGAEGLCAIINDAARLSEQCETRNDALLDPNNNEHQKASDDLCKEMTELSLHATRYLCERILLDMHEPEAVLTLAGSRTWEHGTGVPIVETTIATLKDYFADIHDWLPSHYFFPKCVKHCFDLTVQMYINSFFSNTMAGGLEDPIKASVAIQKDWQMLMQFFGNQEMAGYLGRAGNHSKQVIVARLALLQSLAFLLTPTVPPGQLELEIMTILVQLGSDVGIPAVLHVAGLRNRHTLPLEESAEWHHVIASATTKLPSHTSSTRKNELLPYCLPDLRNSEYLKRIRPTKKHDTAKDHNSSITKNNDIESPEVQLTTASSDQLVRRGGIRQNLGASFRASKRRLMKSDRTLISGWKSTREDLAPTGTSRPTLTKEQVQSEWNLGGAKLSQRK